MDRRQNLMTDLTFCIFNATGIRNKKSEVTEFIEKHKIDILFVSETHLRPAQSFRLRNMIGYRTDRFNRKGGGTAIFLKSNITHNVETLPNLRTLEATAVTIDTNQGKTTLIAAYLSPGADLIEEDFITIFDRFERILLCGDLNSKHLAWNSRRGNAKGEKLYDLETRIQALTQAPVDPTYIPPFQNQHPDVLDVAMVKNVNPNLHLQTINDLTSHHQPVLGKLRKATNMPTLKTTTTTNWEQYCRWLNNNVQPTKPLHTIAEVDSAIDEITTKIKKAANKASTTIAYSSSFYEAFPPALQDLKYLKNRARKKWQKTRNPAYRQEMNTLSRELTKRAREWRAEVWEDRMEQIQLRSRDEWQLIRNVRNPRPPKRALLMNNQLTFDALAKAELFANTYEEQNRLDFQNLENNIQEDDDTRNRANRIRQNPSGDIPELTTPQEVKSIIKNLNSNSAPGPDGVTNDQIKHLPRKPLVLLTRIYNKCLQMEYFPTKWKQAKIVPIPKQGKDLQIPNNYRPISLLSTLGKTYERILLRRIKLPLMDGNVIRPDQFAYQPKLSAEIQLLRISEYIAQEMNLNRYTTAIFLDVEKAFDKVWRDKLITKIEETTDIPKCYIKTIDSFLTNRTFFVKVDDKRSDIKIQEQGIPQGSVLSPLLFILYANDLPKLPNVVLAQFADDTALMTSSRQLDSAINRLQHQLNILELWAADNKIKINAQKTKAMIFTRRRPEVRNRLRINNQEVDWTDTTKYLGVTLDKKLLYTSHILENRNKITRAIHGLYPFLSSNEMNIRTKLRLYFSTIVPMMLYGCPSWGTTCNTNIKKLQILQNRCLKIILKAPWWSRTQWIHEELNVPMIEQQIKNRTASLLNKIDAIRHETRQLENVGTIQPRPWHKVKVPRAILIQ